LDLGQEPGDGGRIRAAHSPRPFEHLTLYHTPLIIITICYCYPPCNPMIKLFFAVINPF
jgi:hypothetical protein